MLRRLLLVAFLLGAVYVLFAASQVSRPPLDRVPENDLGVDLSAPLWPEGLGLRDGPTLPVAYPLREMSSGRQVSEHSLPLYVDASGGRLPAPLTLLAGLLGWVGAWGWALLAAALLLLALDWRAVDAVGRAVKAAVPLLVLALAAAAVVMGWPRLPERLPLPGPPKAPVDAPPPALDTAGPGDRRFGLVEAFRIADRDLARSLGAHFERLVFWWSGLQASPGAALNPFFLPRDVIDRERAQGYEPVGLIISTPTWAAANPADGPRSVPRNLDLPWDHPDNYFGRFAERLARDYAGRIDDWIIWNEPDIQPGDPNASYYAWAGSVEDYYQLLRVAYPAIKAGNPRARLHLAGLTYWVDKRAGRPQYFERLLDLIAADPTAPDHDGYFDVATLHLYTSPHSLYEVPRLYRAALRARGLDKPIWINETNLIPWDDPTNQGTGYDRPTEMRCTLADQAAYVPQAFSLALAGGVERIALYKAQDAPGAAFNGDVDAIERSALVREDGSLRPAFAAYQTTVRYLAGAKVARYTPGKEAEWVAVDRADGSRTTVVWNAAPYPVKARLSASGADAELVDMAGKAVPLAPDDDGQYTIALPPARCNTDPENPGRYLLGGDTYLVVERDVAAAD